MFANGVLKRTTHFISQRSRVRLEQMSHWNQSCLSSLASGAVKEVSSESRSRAAERTFCSIWRWGWDSWDFSGSISIPSSLCWLGLRPRLFIIFVIALIKLSAASETNASDLTFPRSVTALWSSPVKDEVKAFDPRAGHCVGWEFVSGKWLFENGLGVAAWDDRKSTPFWDWCAASVESSSMSVVGSVSTRVPACERLSSFCWLGWRPMAVSYQSIDLGWSVYVNVRSRRKSSAHFFSNASPSSSLCIRFRCCLKLSSRGHFLLGRGQLFPKQRYIIFGPRSGSLLCTHFLWRARSLMVPKPSLRGQLGSSHLKSFLWRASCFLDRSERMFP